MSFNRFPARFGKYIVLDRISVGGMAEVYRAKEIRQDGFSKVIALKRMLDAVQTDAAMAPMFVDEAKLAAQLVHPNIAQTLELGRIEDALYIAMELVWGRDLKAIAKVCNAKNHPFPVGVAAYIIAKAAEALDFAHNARATDGKPMRLVHRDVSPHNLMVDCDGEVKVIDFGVAKSEAKSSETVAGVIKGKFSYMAPEQVIGSPVDARTDIFALGIVLYELLSGERLYDGSSAFSIFDKVVNQPAPRLGNVAQVAPELDEIVARCLAKRPEERFESAAQLADALAPFRIHERSIVGAREAKQLLKTLFPEDEAEMREKMQRYQAVRERDCVDARADVVASKAGQTQILASSDASPLFVEPGSHGVSAPTAFYNPSLPVRQTSALPAATPTGVSPAPRDRRTTDEIETPRPRRGVAISIGAVALVASLVVVVAQLTNVSPLKLVQGVLDLATGAAAPAPAPVALAPPQAAVVPEEVRAPPLPVVTTSELPPRPQVGSVESAGSTSLPAGGAPSTPGTPHAAEATRHTGAKAGRPGAHSTAGRAGPAAAKEGFGYVSIGAKGAASAKVYVDGRDIGYAPVLNYKIKQGSHTLRVVPYKDELPGKPVSKSFVVGKENTPASPQRLVIELN